MNVAEAKFATPLFEESQRMPRGWFWLVVVLGCGELALFGYGLYHQLVLRRPWGNHPLSNQGLEALFVSVAAGFAGGAWLIHSSRLTVRVFPGLVDVNFFPLRHRRIPAAEITSAEPREYSALAEYGGWGIHFSLSGRGWAYNVRGNSGVQLVFRNGKQLLIGTEQPDELAIAIRRAQQ